jgi:hypothetical protein
LSSQSFANACSFAKQKNLDSILRQASKEAPMPHRSIARLSALLLIVTSATHAARGDDAAAASEKVDLKYKLATGTVLRYEIDHRASIRSTIDETTQEAQTKTESVKAWKVTDVLPSGEIEFMSVVERVHMLNHLPDRAPSEYDSVKDKTPPPGYEDTARAIGVPLSVIRMTPRGKITSRNVKLQQPNADKDAQIVMLLPEQPVSVGATWDEPFDVTVNIDTGGTKSIQTRRHYELMSVASGIATIEVTYQVLSPIDAKIESQLVQRLMKGTVRFDIEQGRIASQLFEVDKRVLGFAGPTSSMHYVMRMEEKFTEAKLAASNPLKEMSILRKSTTRKPAAESTTTKVADAAQPQPKATTQPKATPQPEVARNPSSTRRPAKRSANKPNFGKPAHYR